ncbi:barstar family protein [Edwardsiella piscicida]|uniref:barstar family protein n=1 Tax=Edwardsiella piscicida TaxID=1263550 RepID=UPI0002C06808|nr:barstar family protein [Edwardsiella piscicida]AGH74980.1 Putative ribonuclease inhibitor [Edwardsiella piscicida C07-087]EKS7780651.1 barstar family protein [Edwardsiella piscicida]EKS7784113.1 barstar family protein [Edwardsiella piscicida]UCQ23993.1 barstar family protein [Edwardsiella piscicida]UCQ34126.1 barstar family protein [Edwardsiella piscicida]
MQKVQFDFNQIADLAAFYRQFSQAFTLAPRFGNNLDALWDVLTGDIGMPLEITFVNFDAAKKRRFAVLVLLFEAAEEELEGELRFNTYDRAA